MGGAESVEGVQRIDKLPGAAGGLQLDQGSASVDRDLGVEGLVILGCHGIEDTRADHLVLRQQDLRHVEAVDGVRLGRNLVVWILPAIDHVVTQLGGELVVLGRVPCLVQPDDVRAGLADDAGEVLTDESGAALINPSAKGILVQDAVFEVIALGQAPTVEGELETSWSTERGGTLTVTLPPGADVVVVVR